MSYRNSLNDSGNSLDTKRIRTVTPQLKRKMVKLLNRDKLPLQKLRKQLKYCRLINRHCFITQLLFSDIWCGYMHLLDFYAFLKEDYTRSYIRNVV